MSARPAIPAAAERASSWLRPPRPLPVRCTTVSPPARKARERFVPWWLRAMAARKAPASRASQSRLSVSRMGSYPRFRQALAVAAHSSRTLPVTTVSTLSSALGVSSSKQYSAAAERVRSYRRAMARASSQVEESG